VDNVALALNWLPIECVIISVYFILFFLTTSVIIGLVYGSIVVELCVFCGLSRLAHRIWIIGI
jgi:hypothetical protein